ncbi:hypothetical protein BpHYR1_025824 [Brachionus plicatilis]|uniref:Uncharacterized protein n=1 Tax=Brachionus plicatilis TaxID=10195 RepID=A0A3M7P6A0_BRAPC|nr:hypothetical protein BpHYR1_025824 [Brachionus plicatilis]
MKKNKNKKNLFTVFLCSIMQRHNLEHIIGASAILNLAHVKFNLTCVACAKTVFRLVAMHYIQGLENGAAFFESFKKKIDKTRYTLYFKTKVIAEYKKCKNINKCSKKSIVVQLANGLRMKRILLKQNTNGLEQHVMF